MVHGVNRPQDKVMRASDCDQDPVIWNWQSRNPFCNTAGRLIPSDLPCKSIRGRWDAAAAAGVGNCIPSKAATWLTCAVGEFRHWRCWWCKEVVGTLDALTASVGEKSGAIPQFFEDGKRISPRTTFYRLGFDGGGFLRMGSGWEDDLINQNCEWHRATLKYPLYVFSSL